MHSHNDDDQKKCESCGPACDSAEGSCECGCDHKTEDDETSVD